MATYRNTKNGLLFYSAKIFLDSVNIVFEYRFVETIEDKYELEFRPVNELIWQHKPVNICLTTNYIAVERICNYDNYDQRNKIIVMMLVIKLSMITTISIWKLLIF
jgi:hypothetical protein